jgi:AcrR family transcriptional regulator
MARDPDATKRRLFEAAIAEFARHGIAGARIDRIAEAGSANKQLIYAYFGNKQDLFEAVVTEQVARFQHEVHFDADALPEYAGAAYDFFVANPEAVRLGDWHALEPGDSGHRIVAIEEFLERQVREVTAAQAAGRVDATFTADELLAMIFALTRTWASTIPELLDTPARERRNRARRRRAVVEATRRLVDVGPT